MSVYLAIPFVVCVVAIIRNMIVSRRQHLWPFPEALDPPPVDEFELALRQVAKEREALEELLARRKLVP
jgi:hypothetical protein